MLINNAYDYFDCSGRVIIYDSRNKETSMYRVVVRSVPGTLASVLAFDLSDVKRAYAKKYRLSVEVVESHERELKRYLTLCIANPGKCYGMFSKMDNLWYEFICHTPKYLEFCSSIAGRYLHHVPTSSDAAPKLAGDTPNPRQQTIADYEKYFGTMDSAVWNMANPDNCSNGDCCSICTSDKRVIPDYTVQAAC